jgi:hypothetical protein
MAVPLVVVDIAPGNGGLVQVPHQRFLFQRELVEAVSVQLYHRGIVDLLEQVRTRRRVYSGRSTF